MDANTLRKKVTGELGRKHLPDSVWEDILREGYVEEYARGGYNQAKNLHSLKIRVRKGLAKIREEKGHDPPWPLSTPTIESAFTEYVQQMTKVLHEPEDGPYGVAYPDAIRGTFRSGMIRVEAEPWVPADAVDRFYRELQQLVLGAQRNETVQVETLERYQWVRERHRATKESWKETKKAWEETGGKEYTTERQFSRYFYRTERFLDRLRALREEALRLESEQG